MGLAYAIWAGTADIAIIGVLLFHEPVTALKVAPIILIVAGLNLGGAH